MDILRISKSGWRRTAHVNTVAVLISTVLMIAFLITSTSQSGGVNSNLVFASGNCQDISRKNVFLHLLLNIFSTAIIASSNFFMQVLNAPTRSEVDAAHRHPRPVEIGVPSIHNTYYVAPVKNILWALFTLSSVPIHLFFNSAVFKTDYQGTEWYLTMASEGFATGAQYFTPGATLLAAGSDDAGLGLSTPLSFYFDPSSSAVKNVTKASQNATSWKRLEPLDCIKQYQRCNPRVEYQDVVLVVKSQNESLMAEDPKLGWTRDGLLGPISNTSEAKVFSHVPPTDTNSLWFSAQCSTSARIDTMVSGCSQSCSQAWGTRDESVITTDPDMDFPISWSDFTFKFTDGFFESNSRSIGAELPNRDVSALKLQYCLAEEAERTCKLGLANNLVFAVVLCLIVKVTLCFAVLSILREDPLVTPGDAVASFLAHPDPTTARCCTTDATNWLPPPLPGTIVPADSLVWPKIVWRWQQRRKSLLAAIPLSVWLRS